MANPMTITNYDPSGIVIGNAEYEDGLLKFPGNDTYAAGTILARDPADDTWVVCDPTESDGTEIPKGILTIAETKTGGAGNVSVRVLIAGKVRLGKLLYDGGATVDEATCDALRDYGIIALPVGDTAVLDNQ